MAEGDQIVTAEEPGRPDFLAGELGAALLAELDVAEVAVRREGVHAG